MNREQILNQMHCEWNAQRSEDLHPMNEIAQRVGFIQDTLISAGRHCLVLGISGGVDSLVAGALCQKAIDGLKVDYPEAEFIALRLPYHTQVDEDDAQRAVAFIGPDQVYTLNIGPSVDELHQEVVNTGRPMSTTKADFERGNLKARIRMSAQYHVAGLSGALVVGTDHNAEAITGFFTKWGDGACDLMPLRGLNKRQVRALAKALGAEQRLVEKTATADLENEAPGLPDEQVLGLSYDQIDDFLEGLPVDSAVEDRLIDLYLKTQHKRTDPPEDRR